MINGIIKAQAHSQFKQRKKELLHKKLDKLKKDNSIATETFKDRLNFMLLNNK